MNIKHMVERFLTWKLPADFRPDGGIEFNVLVDQWPTGTNLFTVTQAEEMIRHMIAAAPPTEASQDKLARLEREIADRSAIRALNKCAVIENGLPTGWFVAEWCNEISFRYLNLRGLLEPHPTDPSLVRVREDQGHD